MTGVRALAIHAANDRYQRTRGARPVIGGEVCWDRHYRLLVALRGDASEYGPGPDPVLLAVYRFTWGQDSAGLGVTRIRRDLPTGTHPLTLDNPDLRARVRAAAGMPAAAAEA